MPLCLQCCLYHFIRPVLMLGFRMAVTPDGAKFLVWRMIKRAMEIVTILHGHYTITVIKEG